MLSLLKTLFSREKQQQAEQDLKPFLEILAQDKNFSNDLLTGINPEELSNSEAYSQKFSPQALYPLNQATTNFLQQQSLPQWAKNHDLKHVALCIQLNENTLWVFSSQLSGLITYCTNNYPELDLTSLQQFFLATPVNAKIKGPDLANIIISLNTNPIRQQQIYYRLQLFQSLLKLHQ
jgi:hypothetical protein